MHIDHNLRGQNFGEQTFKKCDHPRTVGILREKLNSTILSAAIFCFFGAVALVGAETAKENTSLFFVPEASFLRTPVSQPIPDSKRTVAHPARPDAEGVLHALSAEEIATLPADWKAQAEKNSAEILTDAPVRWIRGENDVVLAAIIDGDSQTTCSLLFAQKLVEHFEDIFGPEFLVAVPTRFRIYLFPKLAGSVGEFAPLVLSDYRASPFPVSEEVFEVSRAGVRAVGLLDDR